MISIIPNKIDHLALCGPFQATLLIRTHTIITQNDTVVSINFTAVERGDNSSYAGSEAREVFINTSSDISGANS